MNGSPIGGDAYDYFVSIPHKTWKANIFDCISGIESHDSICYIDDSCYKYK